MCGVNVTAVLTIVKGHQKCMVVPEDLEERLKIRLVC